jgi:hypothetical protein
MHSAEVRVNFAALMVSLLKAGPEYIDAAEALWDWAEEYLDVDRDELEEELDLDA